MTDSIRAELESELSHLISSEKRIDEELEKCFQVVSEGKSVSVSSASSSSDLSHSLHKLSQFAPCFEVMAQGSQKLTGQIEECRSLSDRLSMMVRRLDLIQIHAQEALACTEDVINIKECKFGIISAIEEKNLPLAVGYIKQVHDIDKEAAKASDDYSGVLEAEKEVCSLVRGEFESAIKNADIQSVLKLCPLLQTVGLEVEARDTFMSFIEENVFISISADAAEIDATDHGTAYAQTLASIFNSAYLVCQQYLPMVIQGMEKSSGDVVFIRRLHSKCSKESGLVLKRYMKFRNVKTVVANAVSSSAELSRTSINRRKGNFAPKPNGKPVSPADMHQILDEIAIILQYCCSYKHYVTVLCKSAESRQRQNEMKVFDAASEFDQMVDELINGYYIDGEHWLMLLAIECITNSKKMEGNKRSTSSSSIQEVPHEYDDEEGESEYYDECFFVLQRCSQRAIATNNINAACAILHFMADHLSNDLLQYLTNEINVVVGDILAYIKDIVPKFFKSNLVQSIDLSSSSRMSFPQGIRDVFSSRLSSTKNKPPGSSSGDQQKEAELASNRFEGSMEMFNMIELCAKYTSSLRKEIYASSKEVFCSEDDGLESSDSFEKIKISMENFEECKECFMQAINSAASNLSAGCEGLMTEILRKSLGNIHFEWEGDRFDEQEAADSATRSALGPFELIVRICSETLSESNKDLLIGMLAATYAAVMEGFISKKTFSFSGAVKIEECVRALNNMFSQLSSVSLRSKFSRLREVLVVLTSDSSLLSSVDSISSPQSLPLTQLHNLSQLSENEAKSILSLRTDIKDDQI